MPKVSEVRIAVVVSSAYFDQLRLWLKVLSASNPWAYVHIVSIGDSSELANSVMLGFDLNINIQYVRHMEKETFWQQRFSAWLDLMHEYPRDLWLFSDCDNFIIGPIAFLINLFTQRNLIAAFQPAGGKTPVEALERWGFVLCCGLVVIDPSKDGVQALFESWFQKMKLNGNDQASINRLLLYSTFKSRKKFYPLRSKLKTEFGDIGVFDYQLSSRGHIASCPIGMNTVFWHVGLRNAIKPLKNNRKLEKFLLRACLLRNNMQFFHEII